MLKYSLGMDASMKDIHVCLSAIDPRQQVKVKASSKFDNNVQGFKNLLIWLSRHKKESDIPLIGVIEATGVYYEACALFLFKAGLDVAVVLPNKAKKYFQALGLRSKNDKIDAEGLARMGAEQALELWQPMDGFFYTLRAMTRHHQSLQELKTNINNQLHADEHSIYGTKAVMKQLKKLLTTIENQLKENDQNIHDHLYSDQEVGQKVDNIIAIKGVGYLTVATILAETNALTLFTSAAQLVSYSGYDVVENQSGGHTGKTKISKKGNSHIRRVLFMPAFNVVRYEGGLFEALFKRIFARNHKKMKAYVAVQRKLLVMIYTLWKKNEAFNRTINNKTSRNEDAAPSFALAQRANNEVAPA
jgi:transposase